MATALVPRSEVPVQYTWDTTALFKDAAAYEAALKTLENDGRAFCERYRTSLATADAPTLVAALEAYGQLQAQESRLGTYPSLLTSADRNDVQGQRLENMAMQTLSVLEAELSFLDAALNALPESVLEEAARLAPQLARYLRKALRNKPHLLDEKTEAALARCQPAFSLPIQAYEVSKATDMHFPDFEADGEKHPLSYVLYENNYCGDRRTAVRRESFKAFSETLGLYRNTIATLYTAQVQQEKVMADLRGHASVFDYLLFGQEMSRELYDRHIDLTMELLAPHMRRYAKLLQKAHGLDEMHFADLKLTLDPDYDPQIEVEDSLAYIDDAMRPMGEEYRQMVMRFWPERWCDFATNKGKQTGGYCTTPNGSHPYILLNWNGALSEVFTLAHELGHAAQGLLTQGHEHILQDDFSWYDVEAPSTFHELLLAKSLLAKNSDPRFQRWVCASQIANTYFHNFVTHFLEAAYQREVYRLINQGESLNADILDELYLTQLKKFWGDSIIYDPGCERTWMRQPHYYMGLYSYTYSASLVISTQFSLRLEKEGEAAVADWLNFLKNGAMEPVEHAKLAGVNIEDGSALKATIAHIGSLVDKLEALS